MHLICKLEEIARLLNFEHSLFTGNPACSSCVANLIRVLILSFIKLMF
jgi:hypothetical protein